MKMAMRLKLLLGGIKSWPPKPHAGGSDQELEACCQVLYDRYDIPNCMAPRMAEDMREWLRAARRPKPPSLKEQALKELEQIMDELHEETGSAFTASTIRRALEALPND